MYPQSVNPQYKPIKDEPVRNSDYHYKVQQRKPFCVNCGSKNIGDNYCSNCGQKLKFFLRVDNHKYYYKTQNLR